MRSNEERLAAVKGRAKELERENGKRRGRAVRLGAVAACLALIAALSFTMPGIVGNFSSDAIGQSSMAASVFQGSGALGYIVIGLLAFALGACVTVVCYQTKRLEGEEEGKKASRENDDDD